MGAVYLSTIMMLLVPAGDGPFYCKWGRAVDTPASPSCGRPHVIRTPLPPSGRRLEFRKSENPGLSGYFIRRKDGTGPVKQFRNLVNLYAVDLLLCPKDFESPRTLLFHLKTPRGWQPVQCKLGPLDKATAAASPSSAVHGQDQKNRPAPAHLTEPQKTAQPHAAPAASGTSSQKNAGSGGPVTSVMDLPSCVVQKNDVFARSLGWGAIGVSLLALIMAAFALARSRRNASGEG